MTQSDVRPHLVAERDRLRRRVAALQAKAAATDWPDERAALQAKVASMKGRLRDLERTIGPRSATRERAAGNGARSGTTGTPAGGRRRPDPRPVARYRPPTVTRPPARSARPGPGTATGSRLGGWVLAVSLVGTAVVSGVAMLAMLVSGPNSGSSEEPNVQSAAAMPSPIVESGSAVIADWAIEVTMLWAPRSDGRLSIHLEAEPLTAPTGPLVPPQVVDVQGNRYRPQSVVGLPARSGSAGTVQADLEWNLPAEAVPEALVWNVTAATGGAYHGGEFRLDISPMIRAAGS